MTIALTERHRQLRADIATLAQIVDGLDRLEAMWEDARASVEARRRGYFTPGEDDRVRQLLLAYRNYRISTHDIINRCRSYEDAGSVAEQLRAFIVGYAAALILYAKSHKLIQAYRHEPLFRHRLNEPEPSFGVEAGFFEDILAQYTSLENYVTMVQAEQFWRRARRDVRVFGLAHEPGIGPLCDLIRRQRAVVHRSFHQAVSDGLAHRFKRLRDIVTRPLSDARYGLQALALGALSHLRAPVAPPCFDEETLTELGARVRPGDILLTRTEQNLTSALLPGFWIHTAVYVGRPEDLERIGLADHPSIRRLRDQIRSGSRYGCVVHAISPQVVLCPLETCLKVDHAAVLRPQFADADCAAALLESLRHLGKPYDFEFDFNQNQRIVCTGLVYRSYHGRGPISFSLVKHLGRYALTCDELCAQALPADSGPASPAPFELAGLVLQAADGRPHVIPDLAALDHLRAIQRGMWPRRDLRV
jgi:hypothetical protein